MADSVRLPVQPSWRFRPKLLPTLAFLVLLPGFIKLGYWQYGKAQQKLAIQESLDQRSREPALQMPTALADGETLRYRRVTARGRFDVAHQILVDNRVMRDTAGYHVMTPLILEGSDMRVLVNRGWVPASARHSEMPVVATPAGIVEVSGLAVIPTQKFFTLGDDGPTGTAWQNVWQNLDLKRYGQQAGFPLQPVVLQMEAGSPHGFVRDWPRPDEHVEKNLGYAWQWWGFATALVAIYLYVNLERR